MPERGRESAESRQSCGLGAGEVLFRQGDRGDSAYVVESGRIEIYAEREGLRQVIATLGPNAIFGEMALFGDSTRTASAAALEDTRLLQVTAEQLRERLDAADPLTRHLLRLVVQRCRELLARMRGSIVGSESEAVGFGTQAEQDRDDHRLALGRLRVEQEIEQALTGDQFQLHFQPILRFSDRSIAGFEALIRWVKPDGTRVSPGEFIPVAEASELICRIGRWVLRVGVDSLLAMTAVVALEREPAPALPLFLTVNLSARQLDDPEWLPLLAAQVERLRGQACLLKLEVTESLMIGDVARMQEFIGRCRELGVQIVLDDFGTGYCSLSYLHLFQVHTMKLDRSFVRGMAVSPASEKVVRGIVGIAHDLGLDIVAEGIETEDQALQAAGLGIDYAQGFYFGRPAPLPEALRLLQPQAGGLS